MIIRIKATDEKLIGIEYIFPESRKSFDSIGKVNSENLIIQRVCGYLMDYFTKGSIDHEKIWAEFHFDEILPTEFTRKVLHRTSQIPFGSKMTYGEIGIAIDSKGYQAIGSVLAHNPFPLLISLSTRCGTKIVRRFYGKDSFRFFGT